MEISWWFGRTRRVTWEEIQGPDIHLDTWRLLTTQGALTLPTSPGFGLLDAESLLQVIVIRAGLYIVESVFPGITLHN